MTEPKTIHVEHCGQCPFLWRDLSHAAPSRCERANRNPVVARHVIAKTRPDWCPLHNGPVTILAVFNEPIQHANTLIDLSLACACGTPVEQLPTVDDLGRRYRSCVACGYTQDIGPAETDSAKKVYRFVEPTHPIGPECFGGSDYPDLPLQDPEPRKGCHVNSDKHKDHEFRKGDLTCLCGKYSYLGHLAAD